MRSILATVRVTLARVAHATLDLADLRMQDLEGQHIQVLAVPVMTDQEVASTTAQVARLIVGREVRDTAALVVRLMMALVVIATLVRVALRTLDREVLATPDRGGVVQVVLLSAVELSAISEEKVSKKIFGATPLLQATRLTASGALQWSRNHNISEVFCAAR